MSGPLVILVGLIYAGIAVDQLIKGNIAMCAVFVGYAFANAGMYFAIHN